MATTIQLLRSDTSQTRPEPNVLANGTPMVNLHESEPGLFFTARDGSLFKIGPAAAGPFPPNSAPQGHTGNSIGEFWFDSSDANSVLRVYDGSDWIPCITELTAAQITSGVLSSDRIPDLSADKITSSVLSPTVGGTGTTAIPTNGQLLIGTGTGWNAASLSAGPNIDITSGSGTLQVGVSPASTFNSVGLKDGGGDTLTLAAPNVSTPYTLNFPPSDGANGAVLVTNGNGQLSFQTSLSGLVFVGGATNLTLSAGGNNGNIVLAPTGSGTISVSNARLTNLPLPSIATDAASKSYVDSVATGLKPKEQVVAATTADIDLTTGGLFTLDTVALSVGDRVLVKNQSLPEQNGIYEVTAGSWVRTSDANTFIELVGATVFVAGGSFNVGKTFLCDSPIGGTIDVNPVLWVLFSSGVGTVTSVELTMPDPFTVSGSPVTTAGALSVTLNTQSANSVFAGPVSGGAAIPTFRVLSAADIPTALGFHTSTGITPDVDATRDLGSPSLRWANIYSADLNLSNEGSGNDIDGTWGSYTIQEGEDDLYLINRRSGKRYKFLLQEV